MTYLDSRLPQYPLESPLLVSRPNPPTKLGPISTFGPKDLKS